MASGFNLTVQLQLQAPTNTRQIGQQIQSGLGNITVPIKIQADGKALAGINNQLKTTQKTAVATGKNMAFLNRNIAEAARRFSVITVATGSFIALARGIKNSTKAAIEFEREMVKISQVTGSTVGQLRSLSGEVTRLSTELGVGNQSLLETARVLSQAGLSATKTKQAMQVLANTTLAPSFDNIIDTTEGAIAILNQFGREAKKTGQDIKFLEQSLDAINQVSKNFAVESADLITAVRRTGGVFEAAGGSINELIALFTSVRQTTRESAETIATGFRTIFTRLQRTETIDALNELGISLTDAEGKFIGPLKAVEALSIGLAGLDPKDIRFNEIVEQLGGFRQIGKVIPLIKQYSVAQEALAIANNASGSTAEDAQTAQQSLAVQFQKVREQFDALLRKFADSETFRGLAKLAIDLATNFLKFAESLENVLPLLTAFAAIKIGSNIAPGVLGLLGGGGARRNMGGRIYGYSGGGWVPGTGSRDTVPAMLTPGEFVIKKSSAASIGAGALEQMNAKGYASGGKVSSSRNAYGPKAPKDKDNNNPLSRIGTATRIARGEGTATTKPINADELGQIARGAKLYATNKADPFNPNDSDIDVAGAFLQVSPKDPKAVGLQQKLRAVVPTQKMVKEIISKVGKDKLPPGAESSLAKQSEITVDITSGSFSKSQGDAFKKGMQDAATNGATAFASKFAPEVPFAEGKFRAAYQNANISQIEGGQFESLLAAMSGTPFTDKAEANATFDFPRGLGKASSLFGLPSSMIGDAKRTFGDEAILSIIKKATTTVKDDYVNAFVGDFQKILNPKQQRKNKGGSISGSGDSVPALLTPGEFVVKKSAAQSIGYSNLNSMNNTGVARFAKGGVVGGIQTFADGGAVQRGQFGLNSAKDVALVNAAAKRSAAAFNQLVADIESFAPEQARAALTNFARNVGTAASDAKLLEGAMEAAHASALQMGKSATRTGKKERGAGGQGEFRSMPQRSGDTMAKITQQADALAKDFEIMGVKTRAGQKAAETFRRSLLNGDSEMTAYYKAVAAGNKAQKELEKESQKLRDAFAKGEITEKQLNAAGEELAKRRKAATLPGAGPGGGPPTKGPSSDKLNARSNTLNALASGAQKASSAMSSVAGAAFAATFVLGTLVQSSSSLSEEQKKIEQAGLNVVSSYVMIGSQLGSMALQVAASVTAAMANSAAKKAEAMASLEVIAAKKGESLSSMGGKGGGGGAGGAVGVAGTAMIVLAAAAAVAAGAFLYFKYTSEKAAKAVEIMVEKANEFGDKELEKIGQTGQVASEQKFVEARGQAAVGEIDAKRIRQVGDNNAKVAATGAAAAGALAAVGTYAVMAGLSLQTIPVVGNILGGVLIGVAAAAAGLSLALWAYGKDAEEERKKQAKLTALTQKASAGFATTTFRAQSAIADFDSAVQQAADANLSAAAQLDTLANGVQNLGKTVNEGNSRLSTATNDRIALETALKSEGLLSATGRETTNEDTSQEDKDRLGQLKELKKQEEEARNSQNKLIQKLAAQEGALRQKINQTLSATINEIASVDPDALVGFTGVDASTGQSSLKGLEDPATDSGKKIIAMNAAIERARKEFEDLVNQRFAVKIQAATDSLNFDLVNAYEKEREAVIAQATAERVNNENQLAVNINKTRVERLTELLVMRKQRDAIEKNNQAMRAFNDVMLGATATARNFAAIDDIGSLEGGYGAVQIDASALDQPLQQVSRSLLTATVGRGGINTDGDPGNAGSDRFAGASDIGKRILQAKGLIDAIPDVFEGFKATFEKGLPVVSKDLFNQLEAAAGLAAGSLAGTPVGDIIQAQIDDILKDAKGKPITADQYQQIIDNIEETLDADLETLKRAVEIQNEFLSKMNQVNQAIVAAQQAYADATAKVIDVQERAADRLADARGEPRSRADKERGRIDAANARLGGARALGARAGDAGSVLDAARAAASAARDNRQAAQDEANKISGLEGDGPDLDKINDFNQRANEAGQAFKNAKAELERMTDQSARANDVLAELAEEQKGRNQLKALAENIAFGGDDQRKDIAMGFQNLQQALAQGGIQNANDEERARIEKTLDSIADVRLQPGGKTGREIKADFTEQEVLRLTGNARLAAAAKEQVMAGSREEQLLAELKTIGEEERDAAQKLADLQAEYVAHLGTIAENTQDAFGNDVENALAANAPNPAGEDEKERARITAELEAKRNQALADLAASEANLAKSQENLRISNENLQKAIEARQAEENPEVRAKKEAEAQKKFDESTQGKALQGLEGTAAAFNASANNEGEGFFNAVTAGARVQANLGLSDGRSAESLLARRGLAGEGNNDRTSSEILGEGDFGNNSEIADFSDEGLRRAIQASLENSFELARAAAGPDSGIDFDKLEADTIQKAFDDIRLTNSADLDMQMMGGQLANALNQTLIPELRALLKPDTREELNALARGGLVYRSVGGSIFQPRGTDTVPAMLTPGEFVLRKAAVDRIGLNTLTAMNNGDTAAVYKSRGGGVGYNKSMNRNRIAGFRRGGMVGRGDVSYASSQGNNSVLQLDPSNIQSVLNEFNANFGTNIDNMIANLGTFAEAATSLATSITNGMDVRIVMSGDLSTAVKLDGDQTEHLKNAIADSILPQIAENVASTIENKIRELKDNP